MDPAHGILGNILKFRIHCAVTPGVPGASVNAKKSTEAAYGRRDQILGDLQLFAQAIHYWLLLINLVTHAVLTASGNIFSHGFLPAD